MVEKMFFIKVSKEVHSQLNSMKIHPRQPFDEVIKGLLTPKDEEEE